MIGCGSALLYLKHTLKHFGCLGRVDVFPDLGQTDLVARLHFGSGRERDAREKHLFEAMTRSASQASPLGEPPVTVAALSALAHAASSERGWLDFAQSETCRQQVLEVTLAETRPWLNPSSTSAPPDEPTDWPGQRLPPPVFSFGDREVDVWDEPVEPEPPPVATTATLAVVKTKTDDKHGWLEAGQTMARRFWQAQALACRGNSSIRCGDGMRGRPCVRRSAARVSRRSSCVLARSWAKTWRGSPPGDCPGCLRQEAGLTTALL